jgi:deoxyadenosine/deoxycytidine kinase
MARGSYIAVAGNIGAGKSSFVSFMSHRFGVKPFFEPNDENPFLADFYGDMPRWGFQSQIYFLASKVALHRQLDDHDGHVIQDRTIWEDAEIFAENLARNGTMSEREIATYRLLFDAVKPDLRPPDLMIYLRCPLKTLRRRIARRGRDM